MASLRNLVIIIVRPTGETSIAAPCATGLAPSAAYCKAASSCPTTTVIRPARRGTSSPATETSHGRDGARLALDRIPSLRNPTRLSVRANTRTRRLTIEATYDV
jgi:hypothetical protein